MPEPPITPNSSAGTPSPTLNSLQKALVKGNAASSKMGATDCIYNARDTMLRASRIYQALKFTSAEQIAATLIPHAVNARTLGNMLKAHWRTYQDHQLRLGIKGWHPVDVVGMKRDGQGIWPNGIILSNGGKFGHISTHVWEGRTGIVSLDQYSARTFHAQPALVNRLINGQLGPNQKPTTLPALINRTAATIMFEWCNDGWGCPDDKYLLDK